MRKAAWVKLLKDETIKRWYENLERGSPLTAKERLRILYRYLQHHNLTPKQLVIKAKKNRESVEDQLHDFVTKLDREGKSPGYILNYIKSVRTWLDYNGVKLIRRIKIRDSQATPTIENEQVPTKEELRNLLTYAGERARVSISLMAFAGIRPQVLGDYKGLNGLKLKDIPDLDITNGNIKFKKVPTQIIIPSKLSKTNNKYITFLNEEGVGYLKAYFEKRVARGEKLTLDSPIIATSPGFEKMGKSPKNYGSRFIETQNITREIREAMRPKYNWRPYVLRAYFDTQMLLAESNGKISHAYRQFFMGHKGDIEARYTTNKGRLTPDMIEDMRRAYLASDIFLTTNQVSSDDSKLKGLLLQQWREQAKMFGLDPMKLKYEGELELGEELNPDQEIKLLQSEMVKRTAPHLMPNGTTYANQNGSEHKIITLEKLVDHLDNGWDMVKELNGNKFLIRKKQKI
jgi:hypothetical protein